MPSSVFHNMVVIVTKQFQNTNLQNDKTENVGNELTKLNMHVQKQFCKILYEHKSINNS